MLTLKRHQEICNQLSVLLRYPESDIAACAETCASSLARLCPPASQSFLPFVDFVGSNSLSCVEEAFTGTFDLQAVCHPYVGYQLCGENQQRTFFMLRMADLYNQFNFAASNELPDHFSEMLRFLGTIDDVDCRQELVVEGLLPALDKCLEGMEDNQQPYLNLLRSVQQFLTETTGCVSNTEELPKPRPKEYVS